MKLKKVVVHYKALNTPKTYEILEVPEKFCDATSIDYLRVLLGNKLAKRLRIPMTLDYQVTIIKTRAFRARKRKRK